MTASAFNPLNIGTSPEDHTGDVPRAGISKIKSDHAKILAAIGRRQTSPGTFGVTTSLGSTTTLNDTTQTWATNQFAGQTLTFITGSLAGWSAVITSNTATSITFPALSGAALGVAVASGVGYQVTSLATNAGSDGFATSVGGTAPSTLIDANQAWTVNAWAGFYVTLLGGAFAGQQVPIVSNTATTLTLGIPLAAAIAAGTAYILGAAPLSSPNGVIYAANYPGVDPTGVTASDVGLNLAIQDAITQKKKLILPRGLFQLSAPLLCYSGIFSTVQIEGQGGTALGSGRYNFIFPGSVTNPATMLWANFNDRPAVIFNAQRDSVLKDLCILGNNLNTAGSFSFPFPCPADPTQFVTNGCRDSQYSPYAGVCFDPFNTATPSDGGYPGMTYPQSLHAGSHGVVLERVAIYGFVVGVMIGPTGYAANGDVLTFRDVSVGYCRVCYANGCSQARNWVIEGGNIGQAHTVFDTLTYGAANAPPMQATDVQLGDCYALLNLGGGTGAGKISGCHVELFQTVGRGGSSSSVSMPLLIESCDITLFNQGYPGDTGPVCPPVVFSAGGPTKFSCCDFGTVSRPAEVWNFLANDGNAWPEFDCCTFDGSIEPHRIPPIGIQRGRSNARLINCWVNGSGGQSQLVSDELPRGNNSLSVIWGNGIGRLNATCQTVRVPDQFVDYEYVPPGSGSFASATVTVGSITGMVLNTTATIAGATISGTGGAGVFAGTLSGLAVGQNVTVSGTNTGTGSITGYTNATTYTVLATDGVSTFTLGTLAGAAIATSLVNGGTLTGLTFTPWATVAFTKTNAGQFFQPYDILCYAMLPYFGVTVSSVPALKIPFGGIVGNNVIANALWGRGFYDTVANQIGAGNQVELYVNHWAPTGIVQGNPPTLTCTTNGTVNLTSVSPVNTLLPGDFVIGAGPNAADIPNVIAGAVRVVSNDGAGNVVLSKTATGSHAGVGLRFGYLSPTTPAVTTVANLPPGVTGLRYTVSDALSPVYSAAVVGGGAVTALVAFNGTAWIVVGGGSAVAAGAGAISILQQTGLPLIVPPSGYIQADGTLILGQAPSSSATASFDATGSGGLTGRTLTFSAASLLGTAVDVGRVLNILDTTAVTATSASPCVFTGQTLVNGTRVQLAGTTAPTGFTLGTWYYVVGTSGNTFQLAATSGGAAINSSSTGTSVTASVYKTATITAQSSTTVATVTLSNVLSGTGPFSSTPSATAGTWLSGALGTAAGTANTTAFAVPLFIAYPNCYMSFPTSPLGSAGVYFAQMSSTTVGMVSNNTLPANTLPAIPGSLTTFSGLTPAAYTQSTGAQTLASVTVLANSMGVNGMLIGDMEVSVPWGAGNKSAYVQFGAAGIEGSGFTTVVGARLQARITNKGVANSQSTTNNLSTTFGTSVSAQYTSAVNTAVNQAFAVLGRVLTNATDFLVVEAYSLQLWPN